MADISLAFVVNPLSLTVTLVTMRIRIYEVKSTQAKSHSTVSPSLVSGELLLQIKVPAYHRDPRMSSPSAE